MNPENLNAYRNRAFIYRKIGKPDLAKKDEEKSLRHIPDFRP
ncbi:unnamed protein product [marine sediment metagenome]|uniref:Uncharacterized protein n=1 Tax=marine sediment metagenome TaxID=412755 RepID=X0W5M3_9ZZZZ